MHPAVQHGLKTIARISTPGFFNPPASLRIPAAILAEILPASASQTDSATLKKRALVRSWSHESYLWYDEITMSIRRCMPPLKPLIILSCLNHRETPSGNPKDRFHFTRNTADYQAESQQGVRQTTVPIRLSQPSPKRTGHHTGRERLCGRGRLSRGTKIVLSMALT